MNTIASIRFNLRDTAEPCRFSDEEIQSLIDQTSSTEAATALGWLLTAAETGDLPVSQSVGNTSESWGQPTEKYKVAMRMYKYWTDKDEQLNGTDGDHAAGVWMELVPDDADGTGTLVSRLVAHQKFIQDNYVTA